jgi:diguanylate cyclase (GGDEF)-like protein
MDRGAVSEQAPPSSGTLPASVLPAPETSDDRPEPKGHEEVRALTLRDAVLLALVGVSAGATLLLDLALQRGVAGAVPYVVTVLIAARLKSRRIAFLSAAGCTLLVVVGFLYSDAGSPLWVDGLNRVFALVAIWVTALMSRNQIRHEARLALLATSDPLTGLLNRRQLVERLERALRRARRTREPLTVCLGDLDGFKAVNDSLGHQEGDRLLVAFAALLGRSVRATDTVGRYGGDEFVLVLPGATVAQAQVVLDRIRHDIPGAVGARRGGALATVTCTFGVAAMGPSADSAAELIRAADQALYRGKAAGRDRVVGPAATSSTADG